jgi:hypothetical protein
MECWHIDRIGKIPIRSFVAAVGIAAVTMNSASRDVGSATELDVEKLYCRTMEVTPEEAEYWKDYMQPVMVHDSTTEFWRITLSNLSRIKRISVLPG